MIACDVMMLCVCVAYVRVNCLRVCALVLCACAIDLLCCAIVLCACLMSLSMCVCVFNGRAWFYGMFVVFDSVCDLSDVFVCL